MPRPSEWYVPVAKIAERIGGRWALAGALAAIQYRLAERPTTDADLYTDWDEALVPALEAAGYSVEAKTDPQVGHPHLLIVRRGEERVDIMLPTVPYQELALERAVNNILTVEDVIIHKLIAWRPRDRDDVASILRAGHDLDTAYIERWAEEWEALDRWREATGTPP